MIITKIIILRYKMQVFFSRLTKTLHISFALGDNNMSVAAVA